MQAIGHPVSSGCTQCYNFNYAYRLKSKFIFFSLSQNQTPDKTLTVVAATCLHKVRYYLFLFKTMSQESVM